MQGANLFARVSLSFQPPPAGNRTVVVVRGGRDVKLEHSSDESGHELSQLLPQWAPGVSSAHRNAFQRVQGRLGMAWWRGPPGMASQHMAIKEEEVKGSHGLWEFWACHAAQTKSSMYRRQGKPQANYEPQHHPKGILTVLARTIIHLTGHPSINMPGIYQIFHPSLQDLCTRDEPQACCLCCPEEQRKICW